MAILASNEALNLVTDLLDPMVRNHKVVGGVIGAAVGGLAGMDSKSGMLGWGGGNSDDHRFRDMAIGGALGVLGGHFTGKGMTDVGGKIGHAAGRAVKGARSVTEETAASFAAIRSAFTAASDDFKATEESLPKIAELFPESFWARK